MMLQPQRSNDKSPLVGVRTCVCVCVHIYICNVQSNTGLDPLGVLASSVAEARPEVPGHRGFRPFVLKVFGDAAQE